MKKSFLLGLILLPLGFLFGQNFYPNAITMPETGFEQLRRDNPYILAFDADSAGNGWHPASRFIRAKAPNLPYTGLDIVSSWDSTKWDDNSISRDSFILDAQNRMYTVFAKNIYDYPGFYAMSKEKYIFSYDTQDRINKIDYYMTQPDSSDNYVRQSITHIIYDQDGKRIRDSILYYYSGVQRYKTHYIYEGNKLVATVQFNPAGDTTGKAVYTYSGDLLTSASNLGFDASADEWTLNFTDTFNYNAQNQVSRRVTAGYVYIEGELYFQPYRNESYEYTNDNQLSKLTTRYWYMDEWFENQRTEVAYGSNGKATEGYQYQNVNGTWETAPTMKYLFNVQAGVKTVSRTQPEINIFPNPAADRITVHTGHSPAQIRVMDLSGKQVFEGIMKNDESLDVSQWENGFYYMVVMAGEQQYARKIVVRH